MALVDDVTIKIKAGDGGRGGRSFHTYFGSVKSHADGGNGGRGGDIFFLGSINLNDLSYFRFKKVITAENGGNGMNKDMNGKKGEDTTILVPLGTTIIDTKTQDIIEVLEKDQSVLAAIGGRGKSGNRITNRTTSIFDKTLDKEQLGEERELHLILNIIADIGLIGLPNAGKSSLLKRLTNAEPKIGNYPFTTLEPNLGTMEKIVLADIPGLVEGASLGKGLGIQFLKHIQKTKILLHCIDASLPNPYGTYQTVRSEFADYDKNLLTKTEPILLTKIDLIDPADLKKQIGILKKTKKKIITTSIYNDKSIEKLKSTLVKLV